VNSASEIVGKSGSDCTRNNCVIFKGSIFVKEQTGSFLYPILVLNIEALSILFTNIKILIWLVWDGRGTFNQ